MTGLHYNVKAYRHVSNDWHGWNRLNLIRCPDCIKNSRRDVFLCNSHEIQLQRYLITNVQTDRVLIRKCFSPWRWSVCLLPEIRGQGRLQSQPFRLSFSPWHLNACQELRLEHWRKVFWIINVLPTNMLRCTKKNLILSPQACRLELKFI